MPREAVDITAFDKGIVMAVDADDTPENTPSFSENIEAYTDPGKLMTRHSDDVISIEHGVGAKANEFLVRDDGTLDLVYENTPPGISVTKDIFGTPETISLQTLPASSQVCMAAHNKEIHVGCGAGNDKPPKWVGRIAHKQFGGVVNGEVQVMDAECKGPSAYPFFHKVLADDTYVYGFGFGESTLYRIKISDGTVTTSEVGQFNKLVASCEDNDPNYMWVLDIGASTYGTLYRVLKADFSLDLTTTLTSNPLPDNRYWSDMATTTGYIWLSVYGDNSASQVTGISTAEHPFLYTIAYPSGAGTATPSVLDLYSEEDQFNTTPVVGSFGIRIFSQVYPSGHFYSYTPRFSTLFELALTRTSSTSVGFLVQVSMHSQDVLTPMGYWDSTLAERPVNVVLLCPNDSDVGDTNVRTGIIVLEKYAGVTAYNSVLYNYDGGDEIYTVIGQTARGEVGLTLPTAAGDYEEAVTPSLLKLLDYDSALTHAQSFGDVSPLFFATRINGQAGVDSLTADFITLTEVSTGALLSMTVGNSANDTFSEETIYYYKTAYVYDGYQMSPLSSLLGTKTNGAGVFLGATVQIDIEDTSKLSPRITHIAVFRASSSTGATEPEGYYRFVQQISVSDSRWTSSGTGVSIDVTDDLEDAGAPYETLTGIPESISSSIVYYGSSTILNNELFVANCYRPELPDASHFVFKSKTGRYDMFNWATDFLKLPFVPTAIVGFNGRLFIFDEDRYAIVNPEGMFIEDEFFGAGCVDPRSILVTDEGMFFANYNDVFFYDGKKAIPLTSPITHTTSVDDNVISYRDAEQEIFPPILAFDYNKRYLYVMVSETATQNIIWAFHLDMKRWDRWVFTTFEQDIPYTITGSYNDVDGNVCYTAVEGVVEVAGTDLRQSGLWISKEFTMGDPSQLKKVYKILVDGTANPTVYYATDEQEGWSAMSGDTFDPPLRVKSIRVKMTFGQDAGNLNRFAILYRPLVGKR